MSEICHLNHALRSWTLFLVLLMLCRIVGRPGTKKASYLNMHVYKFGHGNSRCLWQLMSGCRNWVRMEQVSCFINVSNRSHTQWKKKCFYSTWSFKLNEDNIIQICHCSKFVEWHRSIRKKPRVTNWTYLLPIFEIIFCIS